MASVLRIGRMRRPGLNEIDAIRSQIPAAPPVSSPYYCIATNLLQRMISCHRLLAQWAAFTVL